MKIIERVCQENPKYIDKFSVDEKGIEKLIECGNVEASKPREEKRI